MYEQSTLPTSTYSLHMSRMKCLSPQLGPKAGLDVVHLSLLGRGVVRLVAAHDHHRVVKVAAVLGELAEDLSGPFALISN